MSSDQEDGSANANEEVKTRVISSLKTDLPACDCLVTLFHTALASYRHDTVLKPFPQEFVMKDGNKDIDGLVCRLSVSNGYRPRPFMKQIRCKAYMYCTFNTC